MNSMICLIVGGVLFLSVMCFILALLDESMEDDRPLHDPDPQLIIQPDDDEVGEGHVRHP